MPKSVEEEWEGKSFRIYYLYHLFRSEIRYTPAFVRLGKFITVLLKPVP